MHHRTANITPCRDLLRGVSVTPSPRNASQRILTVTYRRHPGLVSQRSASRHRNGNRTDHVSKTPRTASGASPGYALLRVFSLHAAHLCI